MSFNDPIADLLTRIRNAIMAEHRYVDIHLSAMKLEITKRLKEAGFVDNFLVDETKKKMRIFLKYGAHRESVIHGLQRISRPSLRRYVKSSNIPLVRSGLGMAILSTSKGILSDKQARTEKVGGELLCRIW